MAFVNDYLTEEEKAKFEEYNVLYHEACNHAGLRVGVGSGRIKCTLDRERSIYLFHDINSIERREFIREVDYFVLVAVEEDKVSVAYFDLEDITTSTEYHMYWHMSSYECMSVTNISNERIILYLKEALSAYGISGRIGKSTAKVGFDF